MRSSSRSRVAILLATSFFVVVMISGPWAAYVPSASLKAGSGAVAEPPAYDDAPDAMSRDGRDVGGIDVGNRPGKIMYYPQGYPRDTNVTYTFNLSISLEWGTDEPAQSFLWYQSIVDGFNSMLHDGTDGQMALERVDLWHFMQLWDEADIKVNYQYGRAHAARGGIDSVGGQITMYMDDGSKTMYHEWGHYGLYLPDEYTDQEGGFCTCNMGSYYDTNEFCSDSHHTTTHPKSEPKSCWQQIKDAFPHIDEKDPPEPGPYDPPAPVYVWHDRFDLSTNDELVTVEPTMVTEGEPIYINATFYNLNYSVNGNQKFAIYDGDPASGGKEVMNQSYMVTDKTVFTRPFELYPTPGAHEYYIVADPYNQVPEDSEQNNYGKVQVYVNHKPSVTQGFPSEFFGKEDTPLTVDLSFYELDVEDQGEGLTWDVVKYDKTKIVEVVSDKGNDEFTFTPLPDWFGTTKVDLVLRDSDGATVTTYVDLVFDAVNDLPVVKHFSVSRELVPRGQDVKVFVKGSDIETGDQDLRPVVEYKGPDGDWMDIPTVWTHGFEATFTTDKHTRLGEYQFRANIYDADGGSSGWVDLDMGIEVLNNGPTALGVRIGEHELLRTGSITVELLSEDMEDHTSDLTWTVELKRPDGSWTPYNPYIRYFNGNHRFDFVTDENTTLGDYRFRARVMDSDGNMTGWLENATDVTVLNNLPVVGTVEADAAEVLRTGTVRISIRGSDIEQDIGDLLPELQYTYGQSWTSTHLSTPELDTAKGVWTVDLTPPVDAPLKEVAFRARLTDLDDGQSDWVEGKAVRILNNLPAAAIDGPGEAWAGDEVLFQGSNSSDLEGDLTYSWDFGDEQTSTDISPAHTYEEAGVYEVRLTVKDADGATDTVDLSINVTERPREDVGPGIAPGLSSSAAILGLVGVLVAVVLVVVIVMVRKRRGGGGQAQGGRTQAIGAEAVPKTEDIIPRSELLDQHYGQPYGYDTHAQQTMPTGQSEGDQYWYDSSYGQDQQLYDQGQQEGQDTGPQASGPSWTTTAGPNWSQGEGHSPE